jgi:CspA family cold shock protein
MIGGRIKLWNVERGYGFLVPDNNDRDMFAHISVFQRADLPEPAVGQRYMFEPSTDPRGRRYASKVAREGARPRDTG